MKNEAILNKLVELGYLESHMNGFISLDNWFFDELDLHDAKGRVMSSIIQDALIAECAKKNFEIVIESNVLPVVDGRLTLFEAPYSRQAIIEAFCKVTNITGE